MNRESSGTAIEPGISPTRWSFYRQVVLLVVIGSLSAYLSSWSFRYSPVAAVDFMQYWSAMKLVASQHPPYDLAALAAVQRSHWAPATPLGLIVMYNPPTIIPMVRWIEFLPFWDATQVWFSSMVAALLLVIGVCWQSSSLHVITGWRRIVALVLIISMPAVTTALYFGQTSHLLLLSVAGLLLFVHRAANSRASAARWNYFVAGVLLSVTLVKPHLCWLLYLGIVVFSLRHRVVALLAGMMVGLVLLACSAEMLLPGVWKAYLSFAQQPPIFWNSSTVGSQLQGWFDVHTLWVRLFPTFVATILLLPIVWAVFPVDSEARPSSSRLVSVLRQATVVERLQFLLLLSLPFSPYGWVFDQLLLLPVLMWMVSRCVKKQSHLWGWSVILLGIHIIELLLIRQFGQQAGWWYGIVLGGVYLSLLESEVRDSRRIKCQE